jgi:hypothetical protein
VLEEGNEKNILIKIDGLPSGQRGSLGFTFGKTALLLVLATTAYACGGVERKYVDVDGGSSGTGGSDAGRDAKKDSTTDGLAGSAGSGVNADAGDGASDAAEEMEPPPPPPPPGRPGVSIVAGGMLMTSPKYRAFVATGESPGSNAVLSSSKYKFVGGVVGTTQHK